MSCNHRWHLALFNGGGSLFGKRIMGYALFICDKCGRTKWIKETGNV